jgi:hypothetical protein
MKVQAFKTTARVRGNHCFEHFFKAKIPFSIRFLHEIVQMTLVLVELAPKSLVIEGGIDNFLRHNQALVLVNALGEHFFHFLVMTAKLVVGPFLL